MPRFVFTILVLLAAAYPASSQTPSHAPQGTAPGMRLLLERLAGEMTLESYMNSVRAEFRHLDANSDDALSAVDAGVHSAMQASNARSMSALMIMRADLDGDGTVTQEELSRLLQYDRRQMRDTAAELRRLQRNPASPSPQSLQQQLEAQLQQYMAADTDKDGRISFQEAVQHGAQQAQARRPASVLDERLRQAMTFDTESKGAVSRATFEAAAESLFRTADSDGDGKVSVEEVAAYRKQPDNRGSDSQRAAAEAAARRLAQQREAEQRQVAAIAKAREGCDVPRASDQAKVLLLSAYGTDAISSTTIGSDDIVVETGRVVVEPGNEPLYIVIASHHAVIWQFSGAVDRVERVALSSATNIANGSDPNKPSAAGATGLPADRISFFQKPGCVNYISETRSRAGAAAAAVVRDVVGKEPDLISADYSVLAFAVPSGERQKARDERTGKLIVQKGSGTLRIVGDASNIIVQSGPPDVLSEFNRFSPGGLIDIDPKTVVASQPAKRYDVLPQQAGLMQLVKSGALSMNQSGEFLIHKKMRFPAGLHGAHSVKFLLLRGVPVPDGDPGHSDVMSEETGQSLRPR